MEDDFFSGIADCEAILWQPVLSLSKDVRVPWHLLQIVSAKEIPALYPEFQGEDLKHYAITASGLCHKKKSIALFTLALKILSEQNISSELWLDADKRGPEVPLKIVSQRIQVSPVIQVFLQQAGFSIKTGEAGVTFENACLFFQGKNLTQKVA